MMTSRGFVGLLVGLSIPFVLAWVFF